MLTGNSELGLCGTKINKESFDLSALACKVQAVKDDVYNGRGFAVIRGLNLEEFTIEDITMIYMGLNNYIADKIGRQDKAGNALGKSPALHFSSAHKG